jgi:hypothetical protein
MPFAVELYLDPEADARVRDLWTALDTRGVVSLGSLPKSDHHPHVSLAVFEDCSLPGVADAVRASLGGVIGLPLALASLGFFLTTEAVAFLGVVPTRKLLDRHHALLEALDTVVDGLWPYYGVDALVPHCTLATGVTNPGLVSEVVSRCRLPILGTVGSVHVVEIPGGWSRFSLGGQERFE